MSGFAGLAAVAPGEVALLAVSVLTALAAMFLGFRSSQVFRSSGIELTVGDSRRRIEDAIDRDVEADPAVQELARLAEQLLAADTRLATEADLTSLSREVKALAAQTRNERRHSALLGEYHAQTLAQSQLAFRMSLIFASLGFLIIATTIAVAVLGEDASGGNILALVGGAVIEAVAALFFSLSNQTSAKMADFFDSARVDRSLEEALSLADKVPDQSVQSRLKTVLTLRLAGAEASDDVVRTIIAAADARNLDT